MQNPCPIVFGIGVISWLLPRCDCAGRKDGVGGQNIQPEIVRIPGGIAGVFDCHRIRGIVLAIEESGQTENPVTVGTSGVAAKGNGKQFQGAFLLFESESVNSPKDLVFTERCREDCIRRGYRIGGPERSEVGLSIGIQIQIEMAYCNDGFFCAFAALRAKRIGGYIDIRASSVLMGEPRKVVRCERSL
jgi:hypothetical protein